MYSLCLYGVGITGSADIPRLSHVLKSATHIGLVHVHKKLRASVDEAVDDKVDARAGVGVNIGAVLLEEQVGRDQHAQVAHATHGCQLLASVPTESGFSRISPEL